MQLPTFMFVLPVALTLSGPGSVSADEPLATTTDSPGEHEQLVENYQAIIENLEVEQGAYGSGLSEPLLDLGKAYYQAGLQPEALRLFKRSMHIERVNNGPYSLAQEPMLRGIISIYQNQRNWEDATAAYDQIYTIYAGTYGGNSPETLPVLDEMQKWHTSAYLNLGVDGLSHLFRSDMIVRSEIDLVSRNFGDNNMKLVSLLKSLIVTQFYLAEHKDDIGEPRSNTSFGYSSGIEIDSRKKFLTDRTFVNGKNAYIKIIEIMANDPGTTTLENAEISAELGDWYALFGKRDSAKVLYREAFTLFEGDPDADTLREKLFGTPILLPVFSGLSAANPDFSENLESSDSGSSVRVRLRVNKLGFPRDIELMETDHENKNLSKTSIKRSVRSFRFRPRFADGVAVSAETTLIVKSQ